MKIDTEQIIVEEAPQTFREFHNSLRTLRHRVFVRPGQKGTVVNPKNPYMIKGKQQIKAAKKMKRQAREQEAKS